MDTQATQEVKDPTWIPTVLTVAWFILGGVLIYLKRDYLADIKLNEIGDALAGFFSPVAFLWLVFGYLQQGRELKVSSDALLLQTKELNNSVLQQQELVKVSREQLEIAELSLKQSLDREKEPSRPVLAFFRTESNPNDDGSYEDKYILKNSGPPVFKVSARIYGTHCMQTSQEYLNTDRDSIVFKIIVQANETINITKVELDYKLKTGEQETQIGNVIPSGINNVMEPRIAFRCIDFYRNGLGVGNEQS